jgi:hypothetical protein
MLKLFFFLIASLKSVIHKNYEFTFNVVTGIGDDTIARRDSSDIFKIGNTYYVFYSRNDSGVEPYGYHSTVWLAKSTDTENWTEVGEAIPKGGVGDWDEYSTFTPNVLVKDDKVYVYYTSVEYESSWTNTQDTNIGVAWQNVADIETLPYSKGVNNPILEPSATGSDFDSFRVDDAQMIVQGDDIYLYYKGRQDGLNPNQTRHGVAISSDPLGNFTKQPGYIYNSGHEVMIFRYGSRLRSVIKEQGFDASLHNSIMESEDGLTNWVKVKDATNIPLGGGYFREDNFIEQYNSKNLTWGLSINYSASGVPYLEKFIVT